MNFQKTYTSKQALDLLEQGYILLLCSDLVLFEKMPNHSIKVSSRNFTTRLSVQDFSELYGQCSFLLYRTLSGVDEKKDEEYYAWRSQYQ